MPRKRPGWRSQERTYRHLTKDLQQKAIDELRRNNEALAADVRELVSILDDADTAIATLYIGRDHGITAQADGCLRKLCVRVRDRLAKDRPALAREWAEARESWTDGRAIDHISPKDPHEPG